MSKNDNPAQLIIWRHAEAEDGVVDSARQLTGRGRKEAERTARWLEAHLPRDYRLIASPAVRAQQTAQALSAKFLTCRELEVGAPAAKMLAAIKWPACGGTTVIVGHQPALGRLAALLLTEREDAWSMRKGAAWWLRQNKQESGVSIRVVVDPDFL